METVSISSALDKNITKVTALSALSGVRAFLAPAFLCYYLGKAPSSRLQQSPLRFLQSPVTATVFKVLAIAEIAGDKNPHGPNRTSPSQLIVRTASGALVGAAVSQANGDKIARGLILGGLVAAAATFASFAIRKKFYDTGKISNGLLGGIEDLLAISAGLAMTKIMTTKYKTDLVY
jgi:uncharacterized membrane protein